MRKYWINSEGNVMIMVSFARARMIDIDFSIRMIAKFKECTWFEYYLYKWTRINLKAEDKFKWLKSFIKMKWEYFTQAILRRL